MSVRSNDSSGDLLFGYGEGIYLTNQKEMLQNIVTSCGEIKGDSLTSPDRGITTGPFSEKEVPFIISQIKAVISKVNGVKQVTVSKYSVVNRNLTIDFKILSVYSKQASNQSILVQI